MWLNWNKVLHDLTKDASNSANGTSPSVIISTIGAITISSYAYIYGVLAIDVCRFFAPRQISFQAPNKGQVKKQ